MAKRSRSGGRAFLLFHENTTLGWHVIRRISAEDGEGRVDQRTARHVTNEQGTVIGYQMFSRVAVEATGDRRSSVAISRGEMERMAGTAFAGGQSHTAGMTEAKKLERTILPHPVSGRLLAAEDAVELAMEKVKAYPTLSGEQGWRADVRARVARVRALRAQMSAKKAVAC